MVGRLSTKPPVYKGRVYGIIDTMLVLRLLSAKRSENLVSRARLSRASNWPHHRALGCAHWLFISKMSVSIHISKSTSCSDNYACVSAKW